MKPKEPLENTGQPERPSCAIPRSFEEVEAAILARPKATPATGVMGPYFTLEKSRLQFQGKDVGRMVQQFNQSIRLAKAMAKVLGVDDQDAILSTAINTMKNVHGVDMFHMTHGRPMVVEDVADEFMSATSLGTCMGFTRAPATAVNRCLEAMGMQVRGAGATLYVPTAKGRAYATFRSFPKNETECLVHLFWRPSILPLLERHLVEQVPVVDSGGDSTGAESGGSSGDGLVQVGETEIGGVRVPSVDARELHAFLGVGKDFSTWIKDRIKEYQFVENQDFVCSPILGSKNMSSGRGGHNRLVYSLALDMAKELSMVERTEKGREARQYFLACEKALYAAGRSPAAGLSAANEKPKLS